MKIVVTGATGYIGQRLIRCAQAEGHDVLALSRRPVTNPGVSWQRFDLMDATPITLPEQTEVVFHLAAETHTTSGDASFELRAAERLIQAARAVDALFVFVSSQTAAPDAPTSYGRIKWAIEQEAVSAGGLIVRPGQVYGGAERGLFGILCGLVQRLPVVPVFVPEPLVQPVHVDDLAKVLLLCAATQRSMVVCIAEPKGIRFSAFLQAIARGRTRRSPLAVPVPAVLVRLAARALGPGISGRLSIDRLESLFALTPMETSDDLQRLSVTLRPLSAGMSRSGSARRELLREGRSLLSYVLRTKPEGSLVRRYSRAIECLRTGRPLWLPQFVHGKPLLLGLIDGSPAMGNGFQEELTDRLTIALILAEASPQGARRFLRIGENGSWSGNASRVICAVAADVIRRLMQTLLSPLLSRLSAEHHLK